MTERFYLDFGAGEVEVTNYILSGSVEISMQGFSDEFKSAQSQASFTLIYEPGLYTDILNFDDYINVRITDAAGTAVFTGEAVPTTSREYNGITENTFLQITASDFTRRLQIEIGDVVYRDFYVCNPADPTHSIVHSLILLAGLTYTDIDPTLTIMEQLSAWAPRDEKDEVFTLLNTLLYEYGYSLHFREDGKIYPIKWFFDGTAPDLYGDIEFIRTVSAEAQLREQDSVEVVYYELGTGVTTAGNKILIYRDSNLPYAEDDTFAGYSVLAGTSYPPQTNVTDETTSQPFEVWQEYTDGGIKYFTNKAVIQKLDYYIGAYESDFTDIVATFDHELDLRMDVGLNLAHEEYLNRKARLVIDNPTGSVKKLYYMNIYASVVYRTTKRSSKIDIIPVPKRNNVYESRFVHTKVRADELVKYITAQAEYGLHRYSVSSLYRYELGATYTLHLGDGTTQVVMVQKRSFDPTNNIYTYNLKSYGPFSVARAISSQTFKEAPLTLPNSGTVLNLSPQSVSVPANFDGSGADLSGATTLLNIFLGSIDITNTFTLGVELTGITGSFGAGADFNKFSVTGFTSDATLLGTAKLTATKGSTTYSVLFSVSKARQGLQGETGPSGSTAFVASADAPSSPVSGMAWMDTDNGLISVWSGSAWIRQDALVPDNTFTAAYYSMDDIVPVVGYDYKQVVDNYNGGDHMRLFGSTPVPGQVGGAISMGGTSADYALSYTPIDTQNDFTVYVWTNISSVSGGQSRNVIYQRSNVYGYLQFGYDAAGKVIAAPSASTLNFPTGWHCWTLVYDKDSFVLDVYLDGEFAFTQTGVVYPTTLPGGWSGTYDKYWNGTIEELRIDARTWIPKEVRAAYLFRAFTKQQDTNNYQRSLAASDGVITPEEKQGVLKDWRQIYDEPNDPANLANPLVRGEYNNMVAEATARGITTALTNYQTATEVLRVILFDTPGVLKLATFNSNIAITETYMQAWAEYTTYRNILQTQILDTTVTTQVPDLAPKYRGKVLGSPIGYPAAFNIGDSYLRYSITAGDTYRGVYIWDGSAWNRSVEVKDLSIAFSDIVTVTLDPGFGTPDNYGVDYIPNLVANQAFIDSLAVTNLTIGAYNGTTDGSLRATMTSGKLQFEKKISGVWTTTGYIGADNVLFDTTDLNVSLGYNCIPAAATGQKNVAIGLNVMPGLTSGQSNVALGWSAATSLTTGSMGVFIGPFSFHGWGTSSADINNIAIGTDAMKKGLAPASPFMGYGLVRNVAIGVSAMYGIHGAGNIAIGDAAFTYSSTGQTFPVFNNIAIGMGAGGTGLKMMSNSIFIGQSTPALSSDRNNQMNIGDRLFYFEFFSSDTKQYVYDMVKSSFFSTTGIGKISCIGHWDDTYPLGAIHINATQVVFYDAVGPTNLMAINNGDAGTLGRNISICWVKCRP